MRRLVNNIVTGVIAHIAHLTLTFFEYLYRVVLHIIFVQLVRTRM